MGYIIRRVLLASLILSTSQPARGQTTRTNVRRTIDSSLGSGVAEPCSGNNPCAEGLTCTRSPSLLGILAPRHVCFPLDCLAAAVQTFDDEVNVTAYQEMIFEDAQVTPEEFFMMKENRDSGRPLTGYGVAKEMQSSPKVHRVMRSIVENPIPQDRWRAYESALAACDPQSKLSRRDSTIFGASGPTTQGVLGTVGFGANVGAVLGGGIEFFFAYPNASPLFFIDLGGGLLFGVDAGVSGSIGMVFTGTAADIPGVGFELDLQVPTPFVGPGVSVGVDLNPVWDLSFVLNVGIGIGVGGFSAGYTWGFPANSSNLA